MASNMLKVKSRNLKKEGITTERCPLYLPGGRNGKKTTGYPIKMFGTCPDDKFLCIFCHLVLRNVHQSYCSHRSCKDCLQDYLNGGNGDVKCPACVAENTEGDFSNLKHVFPDKALERELSMMAVTCPNKPECTWKGKLKNYQEHEDVCEHKKWPCPFGCDVLLKMAELEKHKVDFLYQHLVKLLLFVRKIEEQTGFENSSIGSIKGKVDQLEVKIPVISRDIEKIEQMIADQGMTEDKKQILDQLNKESDKIENILLSLFRALENEYEKVTRISTEVEQDYHDIDRMRRTITLMEQSIAEKEVTFAERDARIKLLQSASYDGVQVFRVDNWSVRVRDAAEGRSPASVYSPPFYTSTSGYKCCLRLYPNGDGAGRGSHVSLYFVVMRSEHDAVLTWPFNLKVTFRLLDQTGSDHVTESFRPDPSSSSFRRPLSEMNIASGCPLFVSRSRLEGRSKYVVDDVAFFKVEAN